VALARWQPSDNASEGATAFLAQKRTLATKIKKPNGYWNLFDSIKPNVVDNASMCAGS
jgi:hypothetical protein